MVTVDFTAPSDGAVTVTNLKFKRIGISADADVDDLYLYDGMTRLYQGGSLSSSYATFNNPSGIFTVAAGTTKSVTLKIDLDITSAGKTMGFELTEVTTKNSATVSGTLPVAGNLMTTASVDDLGYVGLTNNTDLIPATAQDVTPGEKDFEVYRLAVIANSQDLQLEYLKLTLLGSVNADDLQNLKLVVAGTTITTGTINSDRELIFDLTSSPYVMLKGQQKNLSVRADIVKGSTRTFRFSVEYSSDLVIWDKGYSVYIEPYDDGGASWSALKDTSGALFTVAAGDMLVTRDTISPTDNIQSGATSVKLGTWKFEAIGEDVKVKTLYVLAAVTCGVNVDNGKVLLNGSQIGSTADIIETSSGTQYSFGSSFIVPAGTSALVDVYGDVKEGDGTNLTEAGGDKVTVTLKYDAGNATGMSSLTTISAPDSDSAAHELTVSDSALTLVAYSGY